MTDTRDHLRRETPSRQEAGLLGWQHDYSLCSCNRSGDECPHCGQGGSDAHHRGQCHARSCR
jgi:hypothetical protein